jgi:hypothetical protein
MARPQPTRTLPLLAAAGFLLTAPTLPADTARPKSAKTPPLPQVQNVEFQPLAAATRRLLEALEFLSAPLRAEDRARLQAVLDGGGAAGGVEGIQAVLDSYCLAFVHINPESRVKAQEGPAEKVLLQQGWRTFLLKVHNEAGVTAPLSIESPNAAPLYRRSTNVAEPAVSITPAQAIDRFLDVSAFTSPPLKNPLSGLSLEYRVVSLFSRDVGKREAKLEFNVGQGTQDLGFRSEVSILFDCLPSVEVVFEVIDHDGKPAMGSFLIRDSRGRVYPSLARRLAPDFFFHSQIYRASGESVMLPPGDYDVEYSRGPEYLTRRRRITVPEAVSHKESFRLERWIHTAAMDWWSGDHHIHAAGCAHYESPTEGVMPQDMMRHILGEDLNVGCVLSWGPCWYFQKGFFEGKVNALSTDRYLMRYDVEVSGFPSSHAGHLSILRMSEDDYPGTTRIEEWPSWDLPVLQWAKRQGAVAGFSHSGWGLQVPGDELPNYKMAPFDGIGANEYIVDVVHDAVDFISMVDTPAIWELNIWYHTLNSGYRCRISGETDFPCIYGDKVGLGRSYVKVAKTPDKPLDYDAWAYGIRDGRNYVSDGRSHLIDFKVGGVAMGEPGSGGAISELRLERPGEVAVEARVAAFLDETPRPEIRARRLDQKPYWDIERARIGESRKVPLELVVNGKAVERKEIVADGVLSKVEFKTRLERSSWVALRIFPSSHTNPVFVIAGGKPIRASKRSAQWCLDAVDVCWRQKEPAIRAEEKEAAKRAYDVAREAYRRILAECEVD